MIRFLPIYRILQPGLFRDRKSQRIVVGTLTGRICGAEVRDRSRSPHAGPNELVANSSCETGRYFYPLSFLFKINHSILLWLMGPLCFSFNIVVLDFIDDHFNLERVEAVLHKHKKEKGGKARDDWGI